MIYNLLDKFIVQGILCEVRVINNGNAWVCPVEDTPISAGRNHLSCVTFEVLDNTGVDRKGIRALTVNNAECGAV